MYDEYGAQTPLQETAKNQCRVEWKSTNRMTDDLARRERFETLGLVLGPGSPQRPVLSAVQGPDQQGKAGGIPDDRAIWTAATP